MNKIKSIEIAGQVYDIDTYDIYNVLDYGVKNDGYTDNYESIQNIFDTIHSNERSSVVYFPAGKYNISHGVVIPQNTTVAGVGFDSYLYGTDYVNTAGVFLGMSGSNITIKNVRVGYNDDLREFRLGSNQGAIGVSTYTYEATKQIFQNGVVAHNHQNVQNLKFENIYSSSVYPLQVESVNRQNSGGVVYKINNVEYNNIFAPNGCVSFALNDDYGITDIKINNVNCAFLRCGWGYLSDNVSISNVTCNALKLSTSGIKVNNVFVNGNVNSRYFTWSDFNTETAPYIIIAGERIVINNLIVNRSGNTQRCLQYNSDVSMSNVWIYNSPTTDNNYCVVTPNSAKIHGVNLNLSGKNLIYGRSANSSIPNNQGRTNRYSDYTSPTFSNIGAWIGATASFLNRIYLKDGQIHVKLYYASNQGDGGTGTPTDRRLFTISEAIYRPLAVTQIPCELWNSDGTQCRRAWLNFAVNGDVTIEGQTQFFEGRNYILVDGETAL